MNVAASIQKEIEHINFDEFKSNPSELFILATLSMNKGQYDKAFFILKKSIDLAIDLYGEDNIEVAKYYNKYASAYIQKLLDSDALFMIHLDKEEMSKDGKSLKIIQEEPQCENEIALYNLDIANEMYIDYLDEYDDVSVKKLSKSTIKVYLELADNYLSYGELEQAQSDFKKASEYFKKAAKIREKYDIKMSRSLAEVYFKLASVLDFDVKSAMLYFYKTKVIMEYHLNELVKKEKISSEIIIDEKALEIESIDRKDKRLLLNQKIVQSEEFKEKFKDKEDIENIIEVLNELYMKIEDVMEEDKVFEEWVTEKKKKMIESSKKEDKFSNDYDMSKVIDISSSLVVRAKRPRIPDEEDLEDLVAKKEKINIDSINK